MDSVRRCSILVLGSVLAAACVTGPSDDLPYRIDIHVEDESGAPVSYGTLIVHTFRHGIGSLIDHALRPDSAGHASVVDTIRSHAAPDSIVIISRIGDCARIPAQRTTVAPPRRSTEVAITMTLALPRARLARGAYCAESGYVYFETFFVALMIDSIAGSVHGRYSIAYQATRQTEDGPFIGERTGDSLYLDLVPDGDDAPCNSRYLLVAPMTGDAIGPAKLIATGGCFASPVSFRLFRVPDRP